MRRLWILFAGAVVFGGACVPAEEADDPRADPSAEQQVIETASMPEPADPTQVASCVEMVKFGTYVGDTAWAQVWLDAGESDAGVQTVCTQIGVTDPARLQKIDMEWTGVQQEIAAAQEPPPAEAPLPARYGTCKEAIAADGGNYQRGVHRQYDWYDDRDNDGVVCDNG